VGNLKEDGSACEFGGCRYTRPASQSNRFSNLSYTMGFSHSLKDDLLIFTKYDDSFRAPHTSELYRLQNGQLVSDVKAVKAKQWELGLRIANFAEKGVFAEASVYRLQKYDGIYQDSDRQFLNGLDSQHQGLEIDLHWQPNDVLSLALAASYANHAYQNNPLNGNEIKDNQIDTAPKLILNAQLTWRVTPDIEMQLESRYLDEYYLDADNSQQYPGHTLYNLRTHWQLHPSVRLSLSVLNLLDTRYAERADFAFGNHRYFVGEPRNLLMKLTYTFD
jgi:outer membrane receptor protein involved in Fe transport